MSRDFPTERELAQQQAVFDSARATVRAQVLARHQGEDEPGMGEDDPAGLSGWMAWLTPDDSALLKRLQDEGLEAIYGPPEEPPPLQVPDVG
jgi:hypothetical protein